MDNEAVEGWKRLLQVDPRDAEAFRSLEDAYRRGGDWQDLAELYLTRIEHLDQKAEQVRLLRELARVYESGLNDPGRAIEALVLAFGRDPSHAAIAADLERLAKATGRWDDLLGACNELLKDATDPKGHVEVCLRMAKWYGEDLGRADAAQPFYGRIFALDPQNLPALRQFAGLHRRTEDWTALAQTLLRLSDATRATDEKKEALAELGEIFERRLGQPDEAVVAYQGAVEIDERHLPSLIALERLYAAGERPDRTDELAEIVEYKTAALGYYRATLGSGAQDGPALKSIERLYEKAELWSDLVDVLDKQLGQAGSQREQTALLGRLADLFEQRLGRHDKACERLEQVLEIDPQNDPAYASLERLYRQLVRWHDLLSVLDRHVAATPDRSRKLTLLAEIGSAAATELDDFDRAVGAYWSVLDLDPENVQALEALSRLYEARGDHEKALDAIGRLAQLTPNVQDRVDLHYEMGRILEQHLRRSEAAVEHYKTAVDLSAGKHAESLAALRRIHGQEEDWHATARILEQQVASAETAEARTSALTELGRVHMQGLGEPERAAHFFQAALAEDPHNAQASAALGEFHARAGRWAEAEPLLETAAKALEGASSSPADRQRLQALLGQARAALGKDSGALSAYEASYRANPKDLATLKALAAIRFKHGDWEEAFKLHQLLLVEHRTDLTNAEVLDGFLRLGEIKVEQGQARRAVDMYAKALEVDSHHRPAIEAAIRAQVLEADWDSVIQLKKRLIDQAEPDEKFRLWTEIGDLSAEKLDHRSNAVGAYREALKLRRDDHVVLHKLLALYQRGGHWKEAAETISSILDVVKDSAQRSKYFYAIAAIWRDELDQPDQALPYFDRALDEDAENLKAFEAIDKILTAKKDWKTLEREYRKMLKRVAGQGKTDVEVNLWHFLGEIYRTRLGQIEPAVDAFQMASRLDPENLERRKILAELLERLPGRFQEATRQHRFLISKDPLRIDSYKDLRKSYIASHKYDRAWCVCAALSFLQKADADERQFFEQYRPKGIVKAKSRLTNEDWLRHVAHPGGDLLLGKIFETIAGAVRAVKVRPHKQYDLRGKDKRDPRTDASPATRAFGYIAQVLNVPIPEVYVRKDVRFPLLYAITDPPATVLAEKALAQISQREAAFLIAKHLAHYRGEHYLKWVLPATDELKLFLTAAIRLVKRDSRPPDDLASRVDEATLVLERGLDGMAMEALGKVVKRFVETQAAVDLKHWSRNVELTACRAGLLVAGDLESAARMIRAEPIGPDDLSADERIKELVSFTVSESYFRLRETLGFALDVQG